MVAIFKFFKKIFLMGHNTKLVGYVPHLGYATDTHIRNDTVTPEVQKICQTI